MNTAKELTQSIPLHDYRPALRGAVSWLGDRYLLAEPVQRRRDSDTHYFNLPRRWHPASRPTAAARSDGR